MRCCDYGVCKQEGIYWLGGFSDAEAYCLEHWAIEQKEAVKALRKQIDKQIEDRKLLVISLSEAGDQPEDADFWRELIEKSFNDAAKIARGSN